jgi:S1-C subfamily serine protease
VARVAPASPAAVGLRRNDVIVEVNGALVTDANSADYHLDKCEVGASSVIKVLRGENGHKHEIHVVPQDLFTILEERKMKKILDFFKPQ